MIMVHWYVVDDGGVYNVISSDMFDSKGRYIENKAMMFNDLDIVAGFTSMEEAFDYAEKLNY